MERVRVGRAQPAASHRSSLILVLSPVQTLVKSISQLKDQQDVFCFRYKTQAQGRKQAHQGVGERQVPARRPRVEERRSDKPP